ncbi:MAG: hypothetical protein WBL95_04645 [Microcoleus sp.]
MLPHTVGCVAIDNLQIKSQIRQRRTIPRANFTNYLCLRYRKVRRPRQSPNKSENLVATHHTKGEFYQLFVPAIPSGCVALDNLQIKAKIRQRRTIQDTNQCLANENNR